jgi:hypothetical protein
MDLEWKGDKSIEDFVGCMYIQHPKERHVEYFFDQIWGTIYDIQPTTFHFTPNQQKY